MSSKRAISAALALSLALAAGSAHAELCMLGKNVQVLWKGEWYPASVKKNETTRCYVSYKGFSSDDDEWVGPERLKIKVLWKGDWYNARVVRIKGDLYTIRYEGYTSDDDEDVPISRMQVR